MAGFAIVEAAATMLHELNQEDRAIVAKPKAAFDFLALKAGQTKPKQ